MGLFGKKKAHGMQGLLNKIGKEMPVEHVTDFSKIAAYGVMTTPALVYDQKVLIAGRVAKAEEIAELLKEVMA